GPSNALVPLNADGSFSYPPKAKFNGTDSFTYRANDGAAISKFATVTYTVNPVNDEPVANYDAYSVNEDTTLNIAAAGVLTNDTDIDLDPLTAVLVAGPSNGLLTLNADGSFSYTPNANFNGTDSFTYRANDGTVNSNIATVTITVNAVNDAPVAGGGAAYAINSDQTLSVSAPGLLTGATDLDGDSLSPVLIAGPSSGSLTLKADGSFTYVPVNNFNGNVSFVYVVSDGNATSQQVNVTIAVHAIGGASAIDVPPAPNEDDSNEAPAPVSQPAAAPVLTLAVATTPTRPRGGVSHDSHAEAPAIVATPNVSADEKAVLVFAADYYANQSTQKALRVAADADPLAFSFIEPRFLWQKLDDLQRAVNEGDGTLKLTVGTVAVASLAMTAGYAFWTIKGGVLLGSVMSQLPAWRFMDPLPIYDAVAGGTWKDEESDELSS
ncbi:MAG: tandem-95 repeat protein, partial [Pirellulales bacterium]